MEIKTSKTKNAGKLKLLFARFNKMFNLLIVLAVLVSGYYFVLEPKYSSAGPGSLENLKAAQAELVNRQKYYADLQTLNSNYEKISKTDIAKIKQILPAEKDIAGLFVQFQELAAQNDMLLASINFNDVADERSGARVKKLSISVDLVGGNSDSYLEIRDFLSSAESNLRLLDVGSVFFSPESSSYSLSMFAYYY